MSRLSGSVRRFLQKERARAEKFNVNLDTITSAERQFVEQAHDQMMPVHRPSWPDFMLLTEDGLVFVEVKAKGDVISPNQHRTFEILKTHGVKVYIWNEAAPKKLQLWGKPYPTRREACKSEAQSLARAQTQTPTQTNAPTSDKPGNQPANLAPTGKRKHKRTTQRST